MQTMRVIYPYRRQSPRGIRLFRASHCSEIARDVYKTSATNAPEAQSLIRPRTRPEFWCEVD